MKVALAADHAGFQYKERIKEWLYAHGHEVLDFGTDSEAPVDYPLFVRPAARAVQDGRADRGVIFGGSGNGEAMVANRFQRIRCAVCWNAETARLARQHNDANMISLGQRLLSIEQVPVIVETWLNTAFEGGRHEKRIRLIDDPAAAPSP